MTRVLLCLATMGLLAAGCPNNGPGPVEPNPGDDPNQTEPADSGVTAPPEVVEPPPPPPPTEYNGDPGTMEVTATFNGTAVASTIEVRRTGESDVVETGNVDASSTTATFSLPPGRYDVRASFPDAIDGMADTKDAVRIRTGQTAKVEFTFDSISQVTLECKRGGRNVNGTIQLRRPGATDYLPQVRCQEEFYVTGGAWEALVTVGSGRSGASIQVPGLQIVGGGRVRTPIMIEGGGR